MHSFTTSKTSLVKRVSVPDSESGADEQTRLFSGVRHGVGCRAEWVALFYFFIFTSRSNNCHVTHYKERVSYTLLPNTKPPGIKLMSSQKLLILSEGHNYIDSRPESTHKEIKQRSIFLNFFFSLGFLDFRPLCIKRLPQTYAEYPEN